MRLSIVIPAKNEGQGLARTLPELIREFPQAEILIVDDGSTDDTAAVASSYGVNVVRNPYPMGNGAAIKRGAREATGEAILFMDGDGQHRAEDARRLLERFQQGYDMVVGARDSGGQANLGRGLANALYNRVASWMTGHRIADLTSGMRIVDAAKFREFLHLLPNGFSYPTTITMAFFRSAYAVDYLPIQVEKRIGSSHIRPVRDGMRFFLIIFKIATLYSPVKLFAPTSAVFFLLGLGYYAYTFIEFGRFTNMSVLLFSASVIVFLIGLVSEQVTSLLYSRTHG